LTTLHSPTLLFLKKTEHEPKAAISVLRKLAALGNNHTFLSSHPAPEKRADRLEVRPKQEKRETLLVLKTKNQIIEYALKLKSK
jgi:predicted Zn-dependent protease